MLLDELVGVTEVVASTRSRLAKVDALAGLLRELTPDELAPAIGFLLGKPRQGRVGVGWRGLSKASAEPVPAPSLTIADLDGFLARLMTLSGSGSGGRRTTAVRDLTAQATAREQDFLGRVLLGEMRTVRSRAS